MGSREIYPGVSQHSSISFIPGFASAGPVPTPGQIAGLAGSHGRLTSNSAAPQSRQDRRPDRNPRTGNPLSVFVLAEKHKRHSTSLLIDKPKNITCEDDGLDTVITRRWMSAFAWVALVFCLIWNVSVWLWPSQSNPDEVDLIVKYLPFLPAVAGLILAYVTIALFVNRTVIRAGRKEIRITHGPLPWRGNLSVSSPEIHEIYVKDRKMKRTGDVSSSYMVFELWANMEDRSSKRLMGGIWDRRQMEFIQETLERTPGLSND